MSTDLYPEHLKVKSELIADQDRAEEVAQDRAQDVSDDITGADFDSEAVLVVDTNECPIQIDSIVQEDYGFRAYGHFAPAGSDQSAELYTSVTRFDPPEPLGLGVVTLAHDDDMQINVVTNTGWNFEDEAYGEKSDWQPPWKLDGTYHIENVKTENYITAFSDTSQSEIEIEGIPADSGDHNLWELKHQSNGEYKIANVNYDLVLAVSTEGNSGPFGGPRYRPTVENWEDRPTQRWEITEKDGAYRIDNVHTSGIGTQEHILQAEEQDNGRDTIELDSLFENRDKEVWYLKKPDT